MIFGILVWQHVSVYDHLQANVHMENIQSLCTLYYGIPYYLEGVRESN
jgi:hypothetical protein